ncbi:MAG: DinB family protein [Gemmatimonadetes bacterium]|nr:DinB family protein [Gemmatimonadota bacterium]
MPTQTTAPSPTLEDYRRQLDAIRRDADDLLGGLSDAQFNWRPDPHRWAVAECVSHLNVSGAAYLPALDRSIADAREHGLTGGKPFRPGLLGGWMTRSMEPPPRMRMRAPKSILPAAPDRPLAEVQAEFMALQDELERRFRDAEGVDLRRARVTSPVASFLRVRLGDAFGFLLSHERRHLWQARRVREEPGFPKR